MSYDVELTFSHTLESSHKLDESHTSSFYCPTVCIELYVETFMFMVSFTEERWRSLRKLQRKTSAIRERWKSTQHFYVFSDYQVPTRYCFRVYKMSPTSVGLKLWRGNTTESGRRTGEPRKGQRPPRVPALRRAPHPPRLK